MNPPRISKSTAVIMIAFAIFIDSIQFLLDFLAIGIFADSIIDIVVSIFFGMWFSHQGVSLMKERPLGFLGTIGLEFVPILNALPTWTVFVWRTIDNERKQSAEL